MSDTPSHPIQAVVKRTGLSAHVIRVWEKRYGAVTPHRTQTNRRLYSDEEIERLSLLRRLSEAGQGIGYVAKLPTNRLKALAMDAAGSGADGAERLAAEHGAEAHVRTAVVAVQRLDAPALGEVLKRAELELGAQGVLQRVIAPLAQQLGELWREGTITAAHEHFATAVLRVFLGRAARPFAVEPHGPLLIVVTPAGQLHELGALLAGATAANLGWRVVYLGASLAAADIAGAARQNQARAVALSIVYPEDDPLLKAELTRLRELLPDTPILAGGRATSAYRRTLDEISALTPADLGELGTALDRIRQPMAGRRRPASA
jgi:MerR family transcriptional regulator, light-induced transcriptional regulator